MIETLVGADLPSDYREFLLQHNGGSPELGGVDIPGFEETDVQVFFGITRSIESSCIAWNVAIIGWRIPKPACPIACDSFGNVFLVSLRPADFGTILYADLNAVGGRPGAAPLYRVASTFDLFWRRLHE